MADSQKRADSKRLICQMLNLTERRVEQLAADGVLPRPDTGEPWNVAVCVRKYIDFRFESAPADSDAAKYLKTKIDLNTTKRYEIQMTIAERQHQLVHVSVARKAFSELTRKLADAIESLPDDLERSLNNIDAGMMSLIRARCDAHREEHFRASVEHLRAMEHQSAPVVTGKQSIDIAAEAPKRKRGRPPSTAHV